MNGKHRYFIELAYEGTRYHGWQRQPNAVGVQEVLNKVLSTILRESIETTGCGRTDTGVHARQFFAHFDAAASLTTEGAWSVVNSGLLRGINSVLPDDIAVKDVFPVAADAHARFDATLRSYAYHVHFEKDPFKKGNSWLVRDVPDINLMNEAAQIIMEYADFSCFSKSNTQVKTNICKITHAAWVGDHKGMVFNISADRFLRNMVRAIVGTLMAVGHNEIEPAEVRRIIESKNRSKAGMSVPACGLFLTEIKY